MERFNRTNHYNFAGLSVRVGVMCSFLIPACALKKVCRLFSKAFFLGKPVLWYIFNAQLWLCGLLFLLGRRFLSGWCISGAVIAQTIKQVQVLCARLVRFIAAGINVLQSAETYTTLFFVGRLNLCKPDRYNVGDNAEWMNERTTGAVSKPQTWWTVFTNCCDLFSGWYGNGNKESKLSVKEFIGVGFYWEILRFLLVHLLFWLCHQRSNKSIFLIFRISN